MKAYMMLLGTKLLSTGLWLFLICITIIQGEFIVSPLFEWKNQGTEEIGPQGQS